jgi:NCS1 family nucleobase:cation symporter-1
MAAKRIYDLNFFAGFLVASISYWALCKISPIPATSDVWMEVGDEIGDFSVVYGSGDEEAFEGGKGEEIVRSKDF